MISAGVISAGNARMKLRASRPSRNAASGAMPRLCAYQNT